MLVIIALLSRKHRNQPAEAPHQQHSTKSAALSCDTLCYIHREQTRDIAGFRLERRLPETEDESQLIKKGLQTAPSLEEP